MRLRMGGTVAVRAAATALVLVLLASAATAEEAVRYSNRVLSSNGWTNPGRALGDPSCDPCDCDATDGPYAYHTNPTNETWLEVGFPNMPEIPPCATIHEFWIHCILRYDQDVDGIDREVEWRLSGVGQGVSCSFDQANGNCRYRPCTDFNFSGLGSWTPEHFRTNNFAFAIRRVWDGPEPAPGGGSSSWLRVKGFRLRVVYSVPMPVAPASVSISPSAFCAGTAGQLTLTANGGSGSNVEWFAGGCAGAVIGNGQTIVVPAPATSTQYCARWTTACAASACACATVTVHPNPVCQAGNNSPVCQGQPVTLTANCAGMAEYRWTGPNGEQRSGNPVSINPAIPGNWQLTVRSPAGCWSSPVTTVVVVNPLPQCQATNSGPVCHGQPVTLTANCAGMAEYRWTGPNGEQRTGNPVILNPAIPGNWQLTVRSPAGCWSNATTTMVDVRPPPPPPTNASATPSTACRISVQNIVLRASGNGFTCVWSLDPAGQQVVGRGETLIVPEPSHATTYYVRTENQCGFSVPPPIPVPIVRGGDVNCDGRVDNFDIDALVVAISGGRETYRLVYPDCEYLCAADLNGDGLVNNFDIDAFVACLVNGNCP